MILNKNCLVSRDIYSIIYKGYSYIVADGHDNIYKLFKSLLLIFVIGQLYSVSPEQISQNMVLIFFFFYICPSYTLLNWKSNTILHPKVKKSPCSIFCLIDLNECECLAPIQHRFNITLSPSLFLTEPWVIYLGTLNFISIF